MSTHRPGGGPLMKQGCDLHPGRQVSHRNLLLLGLSQHGKSTFVNGLLDFQHGTGMNGERVASVGDGTTRCTEIPTLYRLYRDEKATYILSYTPLPAPSVDVEVSEVEGEDLDSTRRECWKQRLADDDFEAKVCFSEPVCAGRKFVVATTSVPTSVPARDVASSPICVNVLDTPGVEDHKGEDDDIVESVIEKVLELETLSGLAMVIKSGVPITPAWRAQVSRYWKLFPMMHAQWVFVHTATDPYALKNPQRRRKSSYEAEMLQRVQVIENAMKEVTGNQDFSAGHIFVESDIEDRECLKSYLAEQHNKLFTLIANFSTVSISELPFQKGPGILAIDRALFVALDSTVKAIAAQLLDADHKSGRLRRLREQNESEKESQEQQLSDLAVRLKEIDSASTLDQVKEVFIPWRCAGLPQCQVEMFTQHPRFTVSIIDASGHWHTRLKKKSLHDETLENGCKKLTIKVGCGFLWTTLAGKIVVSSQKRDVYEVEVREKQAQLQSLQRMFAATTVRQADVESQLRENEESAKETKLRHQTAQAMKAFLNSEWQVSAWRAMKPFYEKSKDCTDGSELMKLFQEYWMHCMITAGVDLDFKPVDVTKHGVSK